MTKEHLNKIRENGGVLSTKELHELGISESAIKTLVKRGEIERLYRRVYILADMKPPEDETYLPIVKFIPEGVICGPTALHHHNLTLQNCDRIDVALPKGRYHPQIEYPPIRYHTYSEELYEVGIELITQPGLTYKIYNPEKCLIDCLVFEKDTYFEVLDDAFDLYLQMPSRMNLPLLKKYAKQFRVYEKLRRRLECPRLELHDEDV